MIILRLLIPLICVVCSVLLVVMSWQLDETDYLRALDHYDRGDYRETYNALYAARTNPADVAQWGQMTLAPAEHYAFARSLVNERPYLLPTIALSTPLYYVRKSLWRNEGETPASMVQIVAGWRGALRGLLE